MAQTSIINSANDYYLRDLLNPDSLLKYVIPKYQREYSWRKPRCLNESATPVRLEIA